VCDLENLKNEEAMTRFGSQHHREKITYLMVTESNIYFSFVSYFSGCFQ
jgi:hypothetical protein